MKCPYFGQVLEFGITRHSLVETLELVANLLADFYVGFSCHTLRQIYGGESAWLGYCNHAFPREFIKSDELCELGRLPRTGEN